MKSLKILLFVFYTNSKLEIDQTPLNLIPDSHFSLNNNVDLSVIKEMEDMKKEYLNCLKIFGIKRQSFYHCVGKDYRKVSRELRDVTLKSENELKQGFIDSI